MASIIKVDTIQTAAGGTPTAADLGLNTTGSVLQVVNSTKTGEVSTTSSSYSDTGLSVTITPSSSSSKILIIVHQCGISCNQQNAGVGLLLVRGASTTLVEFEKGAGYQAGDNDVGGSGTTYLDSPATTSAVTYKTQFNSRDNSTTAKVQHYGVVTSTITAMEIAG